MKQNLIVSSALFAISIILTPISIHAASPSCQDLLANNIYRCHYKEEPDNPFVAGEDCFRFQTPGTQSEDFDLESNQLGILGCDCGPKGPSQNPSFDSKEFLCVTPASSGYNFTLHGTVSGPKIKKGHLMDQLGESYAFECELDSACL